MATKHLPNKPVRQEAWLAASLFLLVLTTFLPSLWNGFVSFDDGSYVSRNPHVQAGLRWESLKWAWTSTEAQNWHPMTWLSHLLDGQLFGLNPAGHHATSVLLHALNSVLLFLGLLRMTGARWRSLFVAAFFGVHPLRVESVAWISERKDVLSVFFFMLTLMAYARYAGEAQGTRVELGARRERGPTSFFYFLALACFALGLMSKPTLVTLPFLLLLLDYWPLGRWSRAPQISLGSKVQSPKPPGAGIRDSGLRIQHSLIKWLLLEKIPFVALSAASSIVTFVVQRGAITPSDTLSVSARVANAVVCYARYLGKLAWPLNLSAIYPHPGHWPTATVASAALLLVGASAVVLWKWRTLPYLAVGWFWFLGALVPVIGVVQVGRQSMADRYSYIPSIGVLLAVVWGLHELAEHWKPHPFRHRLCATMATVAIGACIPLTVRQITFWKNSKRLFSHAAETTTANWIAFGYLGLACESDGQIDEAIGWYEKSLEINPNRVEVQCQLANLLLSRRRFDEALAHFQRAINVEPADLDAHKGLGATLQDLGRLDEAIDQFNDVIHIKPDDGDSYSNLGNCYGMKGRTDDAIRCFEQAVRLNPNSAQNHRELGIGLANKRSWDQAIAQFRQAVQLDPADIQARQALEMAVQQKARAAQTQ